MAFSEYLNFKSRKTYLQTVEDFEFENIREKPRKCSNTNPQVLKQRVKGIREQNESLRKKVHFFKEYILIFCIRTSHNYDIFQCFHYKKNALWIVHSSRLKSLCFSLNSFINWIFGSGQNVYLLSSFVRPLFFVCFFSWLSALLH